MKEHLLKLHQAGQELHAACAKTHARIAQLHRAAAESYAVKSAEGIREDCHKSLAEEHQDLSDHHRDHAVFHAAMVRTLEGAPDTLPAVGRDIETHGDSFGSHEFGRKAAPGNPWDMARAFDKVVPDGVHGVLPDNPLRLIPRPGGPRVEVEDATETIDKIAGT